MNKAALLFFALLIGPALFAAEQKENNYLLSFDEGESTWRLQYSFNSKLRPLLEDSDPSTSYLAITLDGRSYALKKGSFFNQHLEEFPGLMILHWSNKILHVTQSVQVDNLAQGFTVSVSVRNLSQNYISVGLKQILDTFNNPGEADFLVDGDVPVDAEAKRAAGEIPLYWETNPVNPADLRLAFTPYGDRKPDQILFANWKRLSDSDWDFAVKEGRNFSLLPYSIDDSAVGVFYNPVSIPPGTEILVRFALTTGGPALTLLEKAKDEKGAVSAAAATLPTAVSLPEKSLILSYSFQYDLDRIDTFIKEINTLLQLENPVYNTQIEYYQGELEKLKQKLSHYEDIQ